MLNKPEPFTVTDQGGTERTYILSQIPYLSGGRKLGMEFVTTAAPKVGNYDENQSLSEMMFKHVAIILDDGQELILNTKQLVNNHVPDFLTGLKIEEAMFSYNVGFSLAGKAHEFQQGLSSKIDQFLSKILTPSSAASSVPESPDTKTFEPSTD